MRGIHLVKIVLVLLLVGLATNARANAIMFTDRAAWESTITGIGYSMTNIDFENTTDTSHSSVTAGDVVFTSMDPNQPLMTTHPENDYGSGKVLYNVYMLNVQVYLPSNAHAFGFDLGEEYHLLVESSPPTLSYVSFSTGDQFQGPFTGTHYPTFSFFGFLSDAPISSFSMHAFGWEPIIDNFAYAQAAPVPEPTTLLLFGAGILGLAGQAWRNRNRKDIASL